MAHILVIEDDPQTQNSYRQALEGAGHVVSLADNGREGLQQVRHGGEIDLIVLDITMPEMSGREFLEHLHDEAPVIICSGYDIKSDPEVVFHPSVKGNLQKPHSMNDLLQAVELITTA